MDPNKLGNTVIAVDESLSNQQKLNALSTETVSSQDPYRRLLAAVRNARKIARHAVDEGANHTEESDDSRMSPVYYQTPPIKVAHTPKGDLMLDLFMYSPENFQWGRSINASWHLSDGKQSRLVLQEYVSDKTLTPGIAAYSENAPRVLGLIEDSLRAYKSAQAAQDTRSEAQR